MHGDLTTSNMILTSHGKIFLVDFGLSERSNELEAKGVDLHLMKRALQSTHYRYVKKCFEAVMAGYNKIQEIERRGRYVSER
jgi:TP53 regulating kinase-like protein